MDAFLDARTGDMDSLEAMLMIHPGLAVARDPNTKDTLVTALMLSDTVTPQTKKLACIKRMERNNVALMMAGSEKRNILHIAMQQKDVGLVSWLVSRGRDDALMGMMAAIMEFNPLLGYIQSHSSFDIWVKLNTDKDIYNICQKYIKNDILELPLKVAP